MQLFSSVLLWSRMSKLLREGVSKVNLHDRRKALSSFNMSNLLSWCPTSEPVWCGKVGIKFCLSLTILTENPSPSIGTKAHSVLVGFWKTRSSVPTWVLLTVGKLT